MIGDIIMKNWMGWPDWTSGWSDGHMAWYMTAHLLWYAFVVALAAAVAIFVMKRIAAPSGGVSALDILRSRYARGELSKDEFDRMRRDIAA